MLAKSCAELGRGDGRAEGGEREESGEELTLSEKTTISLTMKPHWNVLK
jgi:hypothetical protein